MKYVILPFINFCILTRYVESQPLNPDYATEDHGIGTDSRGFPRGSSSTSAPRNNGPLDPSVPYAVPQKKLKSRRSRGELNDPTVGMYERCCCCCFLLLFSFQLNHLASTNSEKNNIDKKKIAKVIVNALQHSNC